MAHSLARRHFRYLITNVPHVIAIDRRVLVPSLLVLVVSAPIAAAAKQDKDLHHRGLAKQYAPILWFAPDEPVRPSTPHPFAFDGVDNNCNSLTDLEDPSEVSFGEVPLTPSGALLRVNGVSPLATKSNGRIDDRSVASIGWLTAMIENGTTTPCPTGESRRSRPKVLYTVQSGGSREGVVIQYWLYYLVDLGISPHLHDAEHAFVFLRPPPGIPHTSGSGESSAIAAVVGAGHESHTANNILVTQEKPDPSLLLPRALPYHMPFRIELGKHAMAPDRNFDGRFDFGMDSNLFRDSAWGSRDNQATSQGALSIGPFQSWQSFPAVWRHVVLESGFFERLTPYCTSTDKGPIPAVPPDYATFRADPKLDAITWQYCEDKSRVSGAYDLIPLDDLQRLNSILDEGRQLVEKGQSDLAVTQVVSFLRAHAQCLWPSTDQKPWIERPNIVSMLEWLKPTLSKGARRRLDVWTHKDFSDPEEVFKLHLYPTLAFGFGYQTEAGVKSRPNTLSVQFAEVPVKRLWPLGYLPVITKDHRLFTNSTFEISVDPWYEESVFENVRFIYKNWRGGYGGWYAGLGIRQEKLKDLEDLSEDDLFRARAMAIKPSDLTDRLGSTKTYPGLHAGYAFSWTFDLYHGLTLEGRGGILIEPSRREPTELERALGAMSRLRFVGGLTVFFGVKPPRHPKQY